VGVMEAECKRMVYVLPSPMFTRDINPLFTLAGVALDRKKIAKYAVDRARTEFGWHPAAFARQLFGEDGDRQRINGWLARGLPADQDAVVAKKLGLTIEQLHAAGDQDPPEPALPEEAVVFAREWLRLPPRARTHIRGLVLEMLGVREIGGSEGLSGADQPVLQRRRRATATG
jgi:hypothetical protein